MSGKIIGEGAAPVARWMHRRLPFIATAVVAAMAGAALYALIAGGDGSSASAQPVVPPGLAAVPDRGQLPPGPPESLRLPPPNAFPPGQPPDIGQVFRRCMSEHGVRPAPRRGRWTKSSRPDPKTLDDALRACIQEAPRPPYPLPGPGRP